MTTSYAAISATIAREHARLRLRAPPVEHLGGVTLGTGTCVECGGVVYPQPSGTMQACQRCHPTPQIGTALRGSEDSRSGEQVRQREARIAGAKTYTSVNRCPICRGDVRYVVGQRCVVCVTAAVANGEYDADAPVSHPIADYNRSPVAAKVNRYLAPDWPCSVCGGSTRYVKWNTCVTCSNRKRKAGFNQPGAAA